MSLISLGQAWDGKETGKTVTSPHTFLAMARSGGRDDRRRSGLRGLIWKLEMGAGIGDDNGKIVA